RVTTSGRGSSVARNWWSSWWRARKPGKRRRRTDEEGSIHATSRVSSHVDRRHRLRPSDWWWSGRGNDLYPPRADVAASLGAAGAAVTPSQRGRLPGIL